MPRYKGRPQKQLLTYLRLQNKQLGLLLNFNVDLMKNGITQLRTDSRKTRFYFFSLRLRASA
jgi:hypothetical protein